MRREHDLMLVQSAMAKVPARRNAAYAAVYRQSQEHAGGCWSGG